MSTENSFVHCPTGTESAGRWEPSGVGIDTHSRFIQVCVAVHTEGRNVLRYEQEFSVDWPDLIAADAWIAAQLQRHNLPFSHYTIESTGVYHRPVLLALSATAHVVNPLLANPSRRKTDRLDAKLLCEHDMHRMWPAAYVAERGVETLRCILRVRRACVRARTQAGNRFRNIVLRFGHTYLNALAFTDGLARSISEDLIAGKRPDSPGVAPVEMPDAARRLLQALLDEYDHQSKHVSDMDAAALKQCRRCTFHIHDSDWDGGRAMDLISTCPGAGQMTALVWLAEICNWKRFESAKQVAAFCGCDPSLKVSAGKVTAHCVRRGNAHLHTALFHAGVSVINKRTGQLGQWGYNMSRRQKRSGYKKAANAVARRISAALWHMMRTGTEYSESAMRLLAVPAVPDIPFRESGLPARAGLGALNLGGMQALATQYAQGGLSGLEGVGDQWLKRLRGWIKENQMGFLSGASAPGAIAESSPAPTASPTGRSAPTRSPTVAMAP